MSALMRLLYRAGFHRCRFADCPHDWKLGRVVTCGNCREWMAVGE